MCTIVYCSWSNVITSIYAQIVTYVGLPLNVTLNATSSMSLHMDWEEPELDAWDGTVSGYGIECSSDFGYYHENTFGGGQREYDVYNLLPFSNYSCCVLAMTTNGNSKYSCDAEQTLQDSKA